jgi:hypothetical protein
MGVGLDERVREMKVNSEMRKWSIYIGTLTF